MPYLEHPIQAACDGGAFTAVATCDRCGQALAHPCWHEGGVYGADCYEVVSGQRVNRWARLDPDQRAKINSRRAAALVWHAERERKDAELREQQRAAARAANLADLPDLVAILRQHPGDFCATIADGLESGATTVRQTDCLFTRQLPGRAFHIVADIYARSFGRRNSRAYNAAYDRFEAVGDLDLDVA